MLVLLSVTVLVMPSMQHRLVERDNPPKDWFLRRVRSPVSGWCRSPSALPLGFMSW